MGIESQIPFIVCDYCGNDAQVELIPLYPITERRIITEIKLWEWRAKKYINDIGDIDYKIMCNECREARVKWNIKK